MASEIQKTPKEMKNNGGSGIDILTSDVIKLGEDESVKHHHHHHHHQQQNKNKTKQSKKKKKKKKRTSNNKILKTKKISAEWKDSKMTMQYKKGDTKDNKKYRHISLFSNM